MDQLKKTILFNEHLNSGARMVEFGGWNMPVQYTGIVLEHMAVRQSVGLFDVSHMGEIEVYGEDSIAFLNYLCSNNVDKLTPGVAQYNLLLNERGGVIDDIIVYCLASRRFLLCVNAGNTEKVNAWIDLQAKAAVERNQSLEWRNCSGQWSQVAVQGPLSESVVISAIEQLGFTKDQTGRVEGMKSFHFAAFGEEIETPEVIVAATGYTGERGFEIFIRNKDAVVLWRLLLALVEARAGRACGLGARDTLRLEAALPLHGHELSPERSVVGSNVFWAVKTKKSDFIGKDAVLADSGSRVLVGLTVRGSGVIREGYEVALSDGKVVGEVTSGTKTPFLQKAVALAYVDREVNSAVAEQDNLSLVVRVRGRDVPVEITELPFYKVPGKIVTKG